MTYTLVRHNLWTARDFPLFIRGLEPYPVGPVTAAAIARLGGVLFTTEDEAWDAAEGFMYPTGDTRRPANPSGDFRSLPFLKLPLFLPEFSGDLLAA
jgi:hypothetical protein